MFGSLGANAIKRFTVFRISFAPDFVMDACLRHQIAFVCGIDKHFRAKMFIDATYEGDLMAEAGVHYKVGREANSEYGETLDGIRAETPKHQFAVSVDPYLKS